MIEKNQPMRLSTATEIIRLATECALVDLAISGTREGHSLKKR